MNNVISFFRPGPMPRHRLPLGARLSRTQKQLATEIVARFEPAQDSLQARRDMRESLQASGIEPGEDLRQVLRDAGFKTVHTADELSFESEPPSVSQQLPQDLGPPKGLPAFIRRFIDLWRVGGTTEEETHAFVAEVRTLRTPPRGLFVNLLA